MKVFTALLLLYFAILIANIIVGRLFINKIRETRHDLWASWGKPESVFMFKKKNFDLYKFIFQARRQDLHDSDGLYGVTKAMALTTVLSQLGFLAALVAFLAVAFMARSNT